LPWRRLLRRITFGAMKSAYELAMERLDQASPKEKPLTAEKKARLAEIDRLATVMPG
jgi:hypothetical protein